MSSSLGRPHGSMASEEESMSSTTSDSTATTASNSAVSSTSQLYPPDIAELLMASDDDGLLVGDEKRIVVAARQVILGQKKALIALKKEKVELLNQLKEAYKDLESKESHITDLIRDYETKTKESVEYVRQNRSLKAQMAELAQQHEVTKSMIKDLKAQKDMAMLTDVATSTPCIAQVEDSSVQTESTEMLTLPSSGFMSVSASDSGHADSLTVSGQEGVDSLVQESPVKALHVPTAAASPFANSHSNSSVRSYKHFLYPQQPASLPTAPMERKKSNRSFARFFSFRKRHGVTAQQGQSSMEIGAGADGGLMRQTSESDRLGIANEASRLPVEQWRADHVAAWLEVRLGMSRYVDRCYSRVKSGAVLLQLTEQDMERELGVIEPLHRRKLRLAVADLRQSSQSLSPCAARAAQLGTKWVCERLLPWCGLPQYCAAVAGQLVDGRVLLHGLSRKDMEKHMGFQSKRHVHSLLHGVELLKRLEFDLEALSARRRAADEDDADPIVWTNQRLAQWLADNDLHEYLSAFAESGLHGAYLALESGFTADNLVQILGVPKNNSLVRRHLADAFDMHMKPARLNAKGKISRSSSTISRSSRARQSHRQSANTSAPGRSQPPPLTIPASPLVVPDDQLPQPVSPMSAGPVAPSRGTGFVRSYRAAPSRRPSNNNNNNNNNNNVPSHQHSVSSGGSGGGTTDPQARLSFRATVRRNPNYVPPGQQKEESDTAAAADNQDGGHQMNRTQSQTQSPSPTTPQPPPIERLPGSPVRYGQSKDTLI